MATDGKLIRGEFTTGIAASTTSGSVLESVEWCDADVLKILRRRSLAALRAQVEPVSAAAYGRFLPAWHQVGSTHNSGIDGLAHVIDQLAGVPIPASAVEPLVFGQRVR
ncbi:MAG: Lhr family ATP-dependent helicase, partial [Mycobacterium sp.]